MPLTGPAAVACRLPGTPQKGFDTLEEALDALIKHGYGEKEELRKIYLAEVCWLIMPF